MYVSLMEKKGMEKGIEKGILQGMEKGIEKGMEKGMVKEKLETACRMLERGMSVPVIIDLTGLTEDEILRLKREG